MKRRSLRRLRQRRAAELPRRHGEPLLKVQANAVTLTGTLAHVEPLRHTPAGLPLIEFKLFHQSVQIEGGFKRQVDCEVSCIAVGEAATELSRHGPGAGLRVSGFLNRKSRMNAQLVLHAAHTELLDLVVHEHEKPRELG